MGRAAVAAMPSSPLKNGTGSELESAFRRANGLPRRACTAFRRTTRGLRTTITARRLVVLAVAFFCASSVAAQTPPSKLQTPKRSTPARTRRHRAPVPASQPTSEPASQPSTQPGTPETIATARQRLARIAPAKRSHQEWALLTALDFALAVGNADGHRAARLVDQVGYQPLPFEGDLPEKPLRPLPPTTIEKSISARLKLDVGPFDADCLELISTPTLQPAFPAIATWMLPQEDFAVLCRPAGADQKPDWLQRDACLVIRVRGEHATIVGGNVLEALAAAAEDSAAPPEEK